MARSSYDLIVVGAGPAGAEAAFQAARRGARTLLLERHPLPRPKLCGGCISQRAQRYLGEAVPARLIEARMTSVRLKIGERVGEYRSANGYGVFVDRAPFDHWLVERARAAGAELRIEPALAVDFSSFPHRVRTSHGVHLAEGVVLATGSDGPLTRLVRPPDTPERSALGLECVLDAQRVPSLDLAPGQAEFDFSAVPSGFAWRLHHGSCIYMGIGALRADKKALLEGWRALARRFGPPSGMPRLRGHLIPCGGYRRRLGRRRVLLAGDAAGFADAFTGEGIALALKSGRLAAEALLTGRSRGDRTVRDYAAACQEQIGSDLAWSLRFKRIARGAPAVLEALCTDPAIFSSYLGVFAGDCDYKAFVRSAGWRALRRLRVRPAFDF